ncbi:MAG: hypothetical protein ACKO8Z_10200, partial [Prosthecobacter sp.]
RKTGRKPYLPCLQPADCDTKTRTRVTKRGESGLKALVLGKPAESPIYLASNPLTATQKPAP